MWTTICRRMLQEVEWRKYDCEKRINDCQVRFQGSFLLMNRAKGGFFDALQEQGSQTAYGSLLGRLVCFYVRVLSLLDESELAGNESDDRVAWFQQNPLKETQMNKLRQLRGLLDSDTDVINLEEVFHQTIKELFCWTESKKLLEEVECPVQRFLMVACLRDEGNGFIHIKDITPLIAKLIYCIRATVFTELMRREGQELRLEDGLDGLQIYVKDLIQSPFGLLFETMHLATAIAGFVSALPQVVWLGDKEYKALAIHGKKVELEKLQGLCHQLLQDAKRKFHYEVKKGLPGFKDFDWDMFDPKDDISETKLNYSFILKKFKEKRLSLLNQFMNNKVTREHFTKGMNGSTILWNKEHCIDWMKKSKELLEILVIACHLLGGQPARSTELATLRWKNSADKQRGVYWSNGSIVLIGQYSKTRSKSSQDRLIPRYIRIGRTQINGL